MQQHIFPFESEASLTEKDSSSPCSTVQERLATYGSEALDSLQHLGVILGDQTKAAALLQNWGRPNSCVTSRNLQQEHSFLIPNTKA